MIISTFLYIMSTLVIGIFSILPSQDRLPDAFNNAWDFTAGFISNLMWVTGLNGVLIAINVAIHILMIIFAFKVGDWMYNKVRGSG